MKFTRVIALALVAASASVAGAQAQSLRNVGEPAEFPPSSYKGTQYIDSKGCVFVRAGISGDVSWIPRVTRSRNQICNQKPSLPNAVTSIAPKRQPASEPVQITLDAPKANAPVAQPAAPVAKKVVKAAPKPAVAKRPAPVRKPVVVAKVAKPAVVVPTPAAPKPVAPAPVVAQPKVVKKPVPNARFVANCVGTSSTLQQASGKLAVRCGPQREAHYSARTVAPTAAAPVAAAPAPVTRRVVTNRRPQVAAVPVEQAEVNSATRIVPRHVFVNRQNTQNLPVPEGYETVWNDGRLNPKRAEQSILGQAQVRLVWTQTVPRRLIDVRSGRDVTASTPLVYPFVDVASQTRDLGSVQLVRRDGKILKRVVRNASAVQVREPVVSSRSAPVAAPKVQKAQPKATSGGFVNVGTFAAQREAQDAAKRIQRMGLPVRIGKFDRAGKTYRMVLAGPFGSQAQVYLSKLRSAGYKNATLR